MKSFSGAGGGARSPVDARTLSALLDGDASTPQDTFAAGTIPPPATSAQPSLAIVAQPVIDAARAAVVGYELLARFSLAEPIAPDRVFAAAHQHGRGAELEGLALGRALDLAARRPADCFVAVNIDPAYLHHPVVLAAHAGRDLTGLVFELTEHHAFDDVSTVRAALDGLRARGAIIALDDAGAGYSGLTQILELAPEIIKLDRGLVSNIHANEAKRALVQMVGELAARLDAWVLAEGVETAEETDALVKIGVPLLQGYFFGRPVAPWSDLADEARRFLVGTGESGPVRRAEGDVASMVSPCLVISGDQPWPTGARTCVRIDAARRPVAMLATRDGVTHERAGRDVMRVSRDAALAEIAQRTIARHEHLRWDPLVCTDAAGCFEGLVPVERIVSALADQAAPREVARTVARTRATERMHKLTRPS